MGVKKNLAKKIRCAMKHIGGRSHIERSMLIAAAQAEISGHRELIALDFGVAAGETQRSFCKAASFLENLNFLATFKIYGFDNICGLPAPKDYRDHPELWQEGDYKLLERRRPITVEEFDKTAPKNYDLISGDINDTIGPFVQEKLGQEAVIACISVDVDYYSSTMAALRVFDSDPDHYLPVVPIVFDDVFGMLMYNEWCGEQAAIKDFNASHDMRKIHHSGGGRTLYFAQILDHPHRSTESEESRRYELLKLRLFGICPTT